jgi:hypothetical protein
MNRTASSAPADRIIEWLDRGSAAVRFDASAVSVSLGVDAHQRSVAAILVKPRRRTHRHR